MKQEDEFLKTVFSWGVIFRADVKVIQEIKEYIKNLSGVEVVYQTIHTGKLEIIKVKEGEEVGK